MRFNSNLISSFLLVSAVLANPHLERRGPPVEYSDSEAGVILKRDDGTVYLALASIVVPNVTSDKSYASASVWVDIDDDSCGHALRTGILIEVYDGIPTYIAFYQHYPNGPIYQNLTIFPQDTIRLAVTVPAPEEPKVGYVEAINIDRPSSSFAYRVESQSGPFCRKSAKWILQSPDGVPLADFGFLTFAPAMAYGANVDNGPYVLTGDNVTVSDVNGGATVIYPPNENSFTVRYPQSL